MPTRDIVVGAQNSAILYAGLEGGGVYKSTDSGANWSQASTQPANKRVMALAQDPSKYSRLYAATYGGGMFVSTDNAATWAACAGATPNLNLVSLAVDPDGKIYADAESNSGGAVFMSADHCNTWESLSIN